MLLRPSYFALCPLTQIRRREKPKEIPAHSNKVYVERNGIVPLVLSLGSGGRDWSTWPGRFSPREGVRVTIE
jgi:hypothetical protein